MLPRQQGDLAMSFNHHRSKTSRVIPVLLLAVACAILLADAPAVAQHALGRGDALDANPGVGTGGRNFPAPQQDFRARNLLVTGDVAGGRHFRDAVGYRADTDFRGDLGSDELFRFRADAALSSPRFAGLGRVADPFRFGQDIAMLEYRRAPQIGPRPFPLDDVPGIDRRLTAVPGDDRQIADRFTERLFMVDPFEVERLREMHLRDQQPRPIGVTLTEEGGVLVASASPLSGIVFRDELSQLTMQRGVTQFDLARLAEDSRRGLPVQPIGQPHEPSFRDQLLVEQQPIGEREAHRVEGLRMFDDDDPPHVQILKRIVERYSGVEGVQISIDETMLRQLDERFDDLRRALQELRDPERARVTDRPMPWAEDPAIAPRDDEEDEVVEDDRLDAFDPLDPLRRDEDRHLFDPAEPGEDDDPRIRRPMDRTTIEEMIDLLEHGQTIDRLAPPDGTRVNELILLGQSSLRRGDYFNAENRFARALRLQPGHPMASIGMVHAHIGAGLNQAAAITLRQTLGRHPELIDARFDMRILPAEERMLEVIEELKNELDDELLGDQYGLLLAYLGHHRRDRELVETGLNTIEQVNPDDPLLPLLRGLWLERSGQPEK
jgi:hypothetical protein